MLCAALGLFWFQTAMAAKEGDHSPNCNLTPFGDGGSVDTREWHGKVVYLDFWASWCGPCAKSFPFMADLQRELKDRGLQVIGVNLDEQPDDARAFLAKYPVNFTIARDPGEQCARAFDVKAMPSSYLIGRDGVIRHIHMGYRTDEGKQLRQLVEQLLAEKPADLQADQPK